MDTRKKYIKRIALALAFVLSTICGCDVQDRTVYWYTGGSGGDHPVETTQAQGEGGNTQTSSGEVVRYEIPQGWQWTDLQKKDAIKTDAIQPDVEGPLTKLELLGITPGGADTAKSAVREMFLIYQRDCEAQGQDCAAPPETLDLDISGVTVYCALSAGKSFSPDVSWSTYLSFAKNGMTVGFMLYDRADDQKELLEKVVSTIGW